MPPGQPHSSSTSSMVTTASSDAFPTDTGMRDAEDIAADMEKNEAAGGVPLPETAFEHEPQTIMQADDHYYVVSCGRKVGVFNSWYIAAFLHEKVLIIILTKDQGCFTCSGLPWCHLQTLRHARASISSVE